MPMYGKLKLWKEIGMRIPCLAMACILAFGAPATAATYSFHPGHTEVRFYWSHAGVSEQSGEWGTVTGSVEFDQDNFGATTVSVTIQADSVNTGVSRLDDDLRSERFFDTAEYPEITFVSNGATQTGPKSVRVTGDLTIKGITRPLTLDVDLVHFGDHPLGQFSPVFEGKWLGIRATGTLIRSDFGIGFGAPLNSDQIRLVISTEMKPE